MGKQTITPLLHYSGFVKVDNIYLNWSNFKAQC